MNMNDSINNKEKRMNDNKSWVLSLPFYPKLLKRIRIIVFLHLTVKSKILEIIQHQRLNAIKKIIKAYRNFKLINKIKKEYIIHRLISERKKAIIKIQNRIRYYLIKLKLKKIIRKEKGSYTIICDRPNVAKISVKIFTDLYSLNQSMILPMNYCPIRKFFTLPIPKIKFVLAQQDNKKVRFIFIHNGNTFYDENKYEIIQFCGEKVHEINFSDYDSINNTKNIIKKFDEDIKDDLSYKMPQRQKSCKNECKEPFLNFTSDEESKNNSRKSSKDSDEIKRKKFERKRKKGKTCKSKKSNCFGIISILKERKERKRGKRSSTVKRRVNFGTVTIIG